MKEQIHISDPVKFEETKRAITMAGPDKLHVLSDFDRTLTYASFDREKRPSLISVLRDGNYLTPDYAAKAQALYNRYSQLENDPALSLEAKKEAMLAWWTSHFDLLIASGLNRKDVERVILSEKVRLRDGVENFIRRLHQLGIPLVIMSSTGLGGEAISTYLQKKGLLLDNIHIIANFFIWDEQGRAISYRRPILHALNKDETTVQSFPDIFEEIHERVNVLLLGDSFGDPGMVEGFDYKNLLKIGFLNEKISENLPNYQLVYDTLVLDDSSFAFVNKLLDELTIPSQKLA